MNKVKLLHIFSAPQSVFYFLEGQLQYMQANKFEVHIIMPEDKFFSKKVLEREAGIQIHFVSLKREISIFNDLKSLFSIYFILLKIRPDILHLHTPKASFIGALAGRFSFRKNIIYQMHGLVSTDGLKVKRSIVYYLEKYTCFLASKVFAVSNSLRDFAVENGYCSKKKIEVIGNGTINGIDWKEKFNPFRLSAVDKYLKKEEKDNKFIIGFMGRISEEKGILDFLKIISNLRSKISLLAVIVGPDETNNTLKKSLRKYGLHNSDCLKILGEIHDQENVLCQFDVLLFPSKREGFGLVAAEANALAIPVVAYDIPGVKDAIENNKTGKLVEYSNIPELEKAVLAYFENSKEKIQHGIAGRERVMRLFDREKLWEKILEMYQSLVS